MKKYIITAVTGLLFIAPTAAFASFSTSLSYGSSGSAVTALQEFLISENCLSVNATGYFGSLTLAGVKCFQIRYGIPNTGYFGTLSRTEANIILSLPPGTSAQKEPGGWVNMSEGVNATPPISPLVGSGSTTVNISSSSSSPYTLSPLVGSGQVINGTTSMSQGVNATPPLSPLIDGGQ